MKLLREFYNRDTITVARELLGKVLVTKQKGAICKGKIVEVEAYMGPMDKAAHSYNGRRTKRVEVMYGDAGFAYVYFIYGLYYCMNVVTREKDIPQAVLIRALQPLEGIDIMSNRRFDKNYDELSKREKMNLTNGPSKLCIAMDINRSFNGKDLCGDIIYIEDFKNDKFNIGVSKRIGIDYAEEARDYPWRFFIEGNKYVSK
ncbi:3-methyladenine DNA glycosylase [Clostridium tetanomorphum DSM 665]|uniref:DNA-3-methyladenine glycosylase n=1 Tax=Clostridium tetanomorphum TaxID=1553 RepID=UPI00044C6B75|nr:DNA-3-methyladenine glycosylase [Clostridium tetanomorphum]KAJ52176.1 3-methyladenine DNA glycosylase [Clostridium tetanomorphum DSM 665]MBP1866427.1 DNA-3-methyladenine glycosylase [Clostridium tetanomorphum]SQC00438.1 DNA-3-methyladenine glycosylase [Clostridium tetanomorphum]